MNRLEAEARRLAKRDAQRVQNNAWIANYRVCSIKGRYWTRTMVLDACVRDFMTKAHGLTREDLAAVLDDPAFRPQIASYIPAHVVKTTVAEAFLRRSLRRQEVEAASAAPPVEAT